MYYDYKIVPMNSQNEIFDVYLYDKGHPRKFCRINKNNLKRVFDNSSDYAKLDTGNSFDMRLSEKKLTDNMQYAYYA